VGSVIAEHSIEHSLLDSKLGEAANIRQVESKMNWASRKKHLKKIEGNSAKTSTKYLAFYDRNHQLQNRRWGTPGMAVVLLNLSFCCKEEEEKYQTVMGIVEFILFLT